ncbi:MAG: Zn-dependent protease with chaperone function [Acidimicrobiales bacterium]|jgi:Zn-dependent protease with chaperone function
MTAPVTLTAISPFAWEHPTDRAALGALQQIPGFDSLLRKVVGTFGERNIRMSYQAEAIKVGPNQYPDLHQMLVEVCRVLDTEAPPLYISQTPLANAGAVGMDHPFIVINSSLVELATPIQLAAVLGHEVGHVISDHALYRTLLFLLLDLARPAVPLVSQAMLPITLALQEWSRKAEVSCDRAGLLAVQDLDASFGVLATMAGGVRGRAGELDLDAFKAQSDEHMDVEGLTAFYKFMGTIGRTHPYPVVRVAELRKWVDSGAYETIVGGDYAKVGDDHPYRADAATAGRNFSETASQVFEDTEQYVNKALLGVVERAQNFLDDRKD